MQRWMHLLPGRSQLLLVGALIFLVFVTVSFYDLVAVKSHRTETMRQVEQLLAVQEDQHERLLYALNQAQQGQHIPGQIYRYYGKLPKGVNIAEIQEPAPAGPVQP